MHRFVLPGLALFASVLMLAACGGTRLSTQINKEGTYSSLMEEARLVTPGATLSSLEEFGIAAGEPGVKAIPYTIIPEAILGPELASKYELLEDSPFECFMAKSNCSAFILERTVTDVNNVAGFGYRILNVRDHYVGEEETEKIVIVLRDGVVVYVYHEPLSRKPIDRDETDWLAPLRGLSFLGLLGL